MINYVSTSLSTVQIFKIFMVFHIVAPTPDCFERIAVALGVKLQKNAYYASCYTRDVPHGVSCPPVVYDTGLTLNQVQNAARGYAGALGDESCGAYAGHCKSINIMDERERKPNIARQGKEKCR